MDFWFITETIDLGANMPTTKQNTRNAVIARRGRHCLYCGKGPLYRRALHIDHVVPKAMGGGDDVRNLVPACRTCNQRKHDKDVLLYVEERLADIELERAILESLHTRFSIIRGA